LREWSSRDFWPNGALGQRGRIIKAGASGQGDPGADHRRFDGPFDQLAIAVAAAGIARIRIGLLHRAIRPPRYVLDSIAKLRDWFERFGGGSFHAPASMLQLIWESFQAS